MSAITIDHAKKVYQDTTVIEDLSLHMKDGELFTLLGPSGCGKTTLLRMIAGFNTIEGGDFYFGDTRINTMAPAKRNIGMVFQNYAIFPHLSVRDNVAFGLKQRHLSKDEITRRTNEYLELMQIDQFADRKPDQLSGGQQQRVALARALVINPDVLLMDEPLSNLDAKLRLDMRRVIRETQRRVGITTVYVTHDQEEAMAISDAIAVMKLGEIQQIGSPKELYHRPANEFVATFIGRTNMLDAELLHLPGSSEGATDQADASDSADPAGAVHAANAVDVVHASYAASNAQTHTVLRFSNGVELPFELGKHLPTQKVRVSVRPEDFIRTEGGLFEATVSDSVYLGSKSDFFLDAGLEVLLQVSEESRFEEELLEGQIIHVDIAESKINLFSEDGSRNLLREAAISQDAPHKDATCDQASNKGGVDA